MGSVPVFEAATGILVTHLCRRPRPTSPGLKASSNSPVSADHKCPAGSRGTFRRDGACGCWLHGTGQARPVIPSTPYQVTWSELSAPQRNRSREAGHDNVSIYYGMLAHLGRIFGMRLPQHTFTAAADHRRTIRP